MTPQLSCSFGEAVIMTSTEIYQKSLFLIWLLLLMLALLLIHPGYLQLSWYTRWMSLQFFLITVKRLVILQLVALTLLLAYLFLFQSNWIHSGSRWRWKTMHFFFLAIQIASSLEYEPLNWEVMHVSKITFSLLEMVLSNDGAWGLVLEMINCLMFSCTYPTWIGWGEWILQDNSLQEAGLLHNEG